MMGDILDYQLSDEYLNYLDQLRKFTEVEFPLNTIDIKNVSLPMYHPSSLLQSSSYDDYLELKSMSMILTTVQNEANTEYNTNLIAQKEIVQNCKRLLQSNPTSSTMKDFLQSLKDLKGITKTPVCAGLKLMLSEPDKIHTEPILKPKSKTKTKLKPQTHVTNTNQQASTSTSTKTKLKAQTQVPNTNQQASTSTSTKKAAVPNALLEALRGILPFETVDECKSSAHSQPFFLSVKDLKELIKENKILKDIFKDDKVSGLTKEVICNKIFGIN
jgi:hypothetical protein